MSTTEMILIIEADAAMIESIPPMPVIKFAMMEWMEITTELSSKPVCAASIALNIGAGGPSKPAVLQRRLKGEE